MNLIDVISAGPGGKALLTEEARKAVLNADAVFCAPRHADLVPDGQKRFLLTPFLPALDQLEEMAANGLRTAVLVSGDAGLYSLLPVLEKRFGRERLRVVPGVSSLAAFCARLGIPWQEAAILSAHGRALSPSALCHTVRTHTKTLFLLDGERDPAWVWRTLAAGGLSGVRLTVGERISYEDERIAPYEDRAYDALCVALAQNDEARMGLPPAGLEDGAFIRGKTPMTKKEIRVQVLSALSLRPDAVVWDIGAGTGSVSVECARQCPFGRVYAIERDGEALELIRANREKFALENLEIVPGSAPEALAGLPGPTHVFLGGTGGRTREILAFLRALAVPARLCATAVTMESAEEYMELLHAYPGFCAVQLSVSRIEPVGSYHMLRALNPVFIFSADMEARS